MEDFGRKKRDGFPLIPEGEAPCVWVEEGVIAYKICDRALECDGCPLDMAIRGKTTLQPPDEEGLSPSIDHLTRFQVDTSRFHHAGHTWVSVEALNKARVGLDDFMTSVMGTVDAVALPSPGDKVVVGAPFGEIIQAERCFSMVSPLSGIVREVNHEVLGRPGLMSIHPLGDGWLMVVEPASLDADLASCRSGKAVLSWYMREMDWVNAATAAVFDDRPSALGRTFHDGGSVTRDLKDLMPPDSYMRLVTCLLGAKQKPAIGDRT